MKRGDRVHVAVSRAVRCTVTVISVAIAMFVNPGVACGPADDEPQWQYAEADMQQAVLGTYEGSIVTDAGASQTITLTLLEAMQDNVSQPTSRRRILCGSRSFFVKPAGACVTATFMDIKGTINSTVTGIPSSGVTGPFIAGLTLEGGRLELMTDAGDGITAEYRDGALTDWGYANANGSLTFDLARTSAP